MHEDQQAGQPRSFACAEAGVDTLSTHTPLMVKQMPRGNMMEFITLSVRPLYSPKKTIPPSTLTMIQKLC